METKIKLGFSQDENQLEDIIIDVKLSYNKSQFHEFIEETLRRKGLENDFKDRLTGVINEIEKEKNIGIGVVDRNEILCEKGILRIIDKMEHKYKSDLHEDYDDDMPF